MKGKGFLLLIAGLALLAQPGYPAAPNLPDHDRTPGASDPDITQTNYREVLCKGADGKKHHTTDAKRPTSSYTTALKQQQLAEWDYSNKRVGSYEEDHLISLELGGDEASPKNLWPQPYHDRWGAKVKDTLELELGRRICLPAANTEYLTLTQARTAVTGDWIASYKHYVCGRKPKLTPKMTAQCKLQ
jgi:hypothetical protein